MLTSILIANRGEIARRINRTARAMGVTTVAVYSEADAAAAYVLEADLAQAIGPAPPAQSYLNQDAIIAAALATGAQAIHPGYGFLSENAAFARAVMAAGLVWVGPSPETIEAIGNKAAARELMEAAGMPVNPGARVASAREAAQAAERLGMPVMVKAAAGGGGIGMKIVHDPAELWAVCERTAAQAERLFGDGGLLVERYLEKARHVEIQILGLNDGRVVILGDRDCSAQRRFQKILEESPSPGVSAALRERMYIAAAKAMTALRYRGVGTVECLVSKDDFVFLEVNARLQVEHPVTELTTGIDLVAEQLRVAAGDPPGFDPDAIARSGHAVEFRICAEDPVRFFPSPGTIKRWVEPAGTGVRIDAGYRAGDEVTTFYDPLLAKLCAWGEDREMAMRRLGTAAEAFQIDGIKTNLPFLFRLLANSDFRRGSYDTGLVPSIQATGK